MIESKRVEKDLKIDKSMPLYLFNKRIFDIAISLVAILLLSPVYLLVWLVNVLSKSNKGPLLYGQVRMGLNGKNSRCISSGLWLLAQRISYITTKNYMLNTKITRTS